LFVCDGDGADQRVGLVLGDETDGAGRGVRGQVVGEREIDPVAVLGDDDVAQVDVHVVARF